MTTPEWGYLLPPAEAKAAYRRDAMVNDIAGICLMVASIPLWLFIGWIAWQFAAALIS